MPQPVTVENLYQAAMGCDACFFPGSKLHLPTVDLPQPRWVGPSYHTSDPRVMIVMLNPGQGDGAQLGQNILLKNLLHRYKRKEVGLRTVFQFQREHMGVWGRPQGRFVPFYTAALGLELGSLAFLNIALCATRENRYPRSMLSRCFEAHTAAIASTLQPDMVLLSGAAAHSFVADFSHCLPGAQVVPMLHYAHRKGVAVEACEHSRIRKIIAAAGGKSA